MRGWDYSQSGFYFVTICTQDRVNLFGDIVDGVMVLNDYGVIARDQWFGLGNRFPNIFLDAFCVMPNHIHGVIVINNETDLIGAQTRIQNGSQTRAQASSAPTLGAIIRAYKSLTVKHIINLDTRIVGAPLACAHYNNTIGKIFQRNYHEHIIRNQKSYDIISKYIRENPLNWEKDSLVGANINSPHNLNQ